MREFFKKLLRFVPYVGALDSRVGRLSNELGSSRRREVDLSKRLALAKERIEMFESGKNFRATSTALLRHLLSSIDLEDVRGTHEPSDPNERKEYVSRLASNFDLTQKVIKRFIASQEEFLARGGAVYHGDELKQTVFARGTINGLFLILDSLKDAYDEHMRNITSKPEPPDQRHVFPQV